MRPTFTVITLVVGFLLLVSFLSLLISTPVGKLLESLTDREVLFAIRFSLQTAAISTVISMSLAIPISYALARYNFPFKRVLRVILDLPMAFPEILTGLVLLMLFSNLLTPLLKDIGVRVVFTPTAVVIAQIAVSLPFAVKVLYTSFAQIDRRYEWVARSLGYGAFGTFLRVTLPMARAGLVSASVVAFARAIGAFGAVLVFAGGIRMKTETLPVGVFLSLSYGEFDKAVAMGVILMGIAFLTLFVLEIFTPSERKDFRG